MCLYKINALCRHSPDGANTVSFHPPPARMMGKEEERRHKLMKLREGAKKKLHHVPHARSARTEDLRPIGRLRGSRHITPRIAEARIETVTACVVGRSYITPRYDGPAGAVAGGLGTDTDRTTDSTVGLPHQPPVVLRRLTLSQSAVASTAWAGPQGCLRFPAARVPIHRTHTHTHTYTVITSVNVMSMLCFH